MQNHSTRMPCRANWVTSGSRYLALIRCKCRACHSFERPQAVKGLRLWGNCEIQPERQEAVLLSCAEADCPVLDWMECYLL